MQRGQSSTYCHTASLSLWQAGDTGGTALEEMDGWRPGVPGGLSWDRIIAWPSLERTLKIIWFQSLAVGRADVSVDVTTSRTSKSREYLSCPTLAIQPLVRWQAAPDVWRDRDLHDHQ